MNIKTHALTLGLLAALGLSAIVSAQTPTPQDKAGTDAAMNQQDPAQSPMPQASPPTGESMSTPESPMPPERPMSPEAPMPPDAPMPTDAMPPADAPMPTDPMAPPPPAGAPMPPMGAPAVTSSPADSVVGEYKIDFAAMDKNSDGNLSRAEAKSNATLTAEFRAVDNDHNGKLSQAELKGWM